MKPTNTRESAAALVIDAMDPEFFDACCHPVRLSLLKRLIEAGPLDIASIASGFSQHRSVISRHLMQMERAEILTSQKSGREVTYDVDGPGIIAKLDRLTSAAKALTAICCPDPKETKDE